MDLFPDLLPAGYTDDFSGLFGALVTVAMFIDDDSKDQAKKKIKIWFGEDAIHDMKAVDDKLDRKS